MAKLNPQEKWKNLERSGKITLAAIDAIDNETEWQEVEPKWWCEMIEYRQIMIRDKTDALTKAQAEELFKSARMPLHAYMYYI